MRLNRYFTINNSPYHFPTVTIIVVEGLVQTLTIVPDHQHIGFPTQTTVKFFTRIVPAKKIQQWLGLGLCLALAGVAWWLALPEPNAYDSYY